MANNKNNKTLPLIELGLKSSGSAIIELLELHNWLKGSAKLKPVNKKTSNYMLKTKNMHLYS